MIHQTSLSDLLRSVADGGDTTLGGIVEAMGERSFGALMLLLAAPNLIPLPPGSSAVFGAPLVFIAAQMMIGSVKLWLPRRLADVKIDGKRLAYLTDKLLPHIARVERLLKPRGAVLVSPFWERLAGAACLALSIVLFLPIPFANMAPALSLCCFALGLIAQDSVAMALGWLGTIATGVILFLLTSAVTAAVEALWRYVFGG
ncbi:exopolysaccharide biosynthesis protein [soil metagenome]